MRRRPASRLIVLGPSGRVLLFRFAHRDGALKGQEYWATPGGGVDDGETFAQAAARELFEETGIRIQELGPEIFRSEFPLQLADGEYVMADERFFAVEAPDEHLERGGWTASEVEVMAEHRWWSTDELRRTSQTVWPENVVDLMDIAKALLAEREA